jgi:hypothetical protein
MPTRLFAYVRGHHVGLLALFVALGGTSYAAISSIPGPDGVIHACYQKTKGSLRVVPAGTRCLKSERALAFNQQGIPGPRGSQGLQGLQGSQGSQGSQGLQGSQGPQGIAGTARAYAQVFKDAPSYYAPRTKGFTGTPSRPATGVYCLTVDPATGIDPTTDTAVAGVEWGNTASTSNIGFVEVRGFNTGDCAANQFDVHTLDGTGAASNLVAFTIIVP